MSFFNEKNFQELRIRGEVFRLKAPHELGLANELYERTGQNQAQIVNSSGRVVQIDGDPVVLVA